MGQKRGIETETETGRHRERERGEGEKERERERERKGGMIMVIRKDKKRVSFQNMIVLFF